MSVVAAPPRLQEAVRSSAAVKGAVYDKSAKRLIGTFDFLHPKDASLSDKAVLATGKLRIVKPSAAQQLQHSHRPHSRRQPSTSASCSHSAPSVPAPPASSASSCDSLSTSLTDSLSLTSTSTFPDAYTATRPSSPRVHSRRSVSSSALPFPTQRSDTTPTAQTASALTASSLSSPSHQRAHTAEELSSKQAGQHEPVTPRQHSVNSSSSSDSRTPPQSPQSAERLTGPTPPPTVRKASRTDESAGISSANRTSSGLSCSGSVAEVERTRRMDSSGEMASRDESAHNGRRLEEGEEESEELTNTTLADASLQESDHGDERRKRGDEGEGGGGGGGGNGGDGNQGSDPPGNESANESADGIADILHFLRQSIVALSPRTPTSSAAPTLQQLDGLPASALLALYKTVLAPVLSAHTDVVQLREEVSALQAKMTESEQAGLRECKRQVDKTRAEAEARHAEELRRLQDKRDRRAAKEQRSGRSNTTGVTGSSGRHNNTLANVSYFNQSLSFHDMSIDPTLSLTTDMLEPRTLTFTLSALDLSAHCPSESHVTLALFSSRLASHSLWNFVGQTESRLPSSASAASLSFERRLVMREVKTWHARDKLRVSAYCLAAQKAGCEERKEMVGQVECDTYRLFTSFSQQQQPVQSVAWEALKAQETADAIQGYSVRQLCVPLVDERGLQCGATRLLIHAHITPPLTCDSYPPSPERVRRAGRGGALHVDSSSLNLSLINDSLASLNHSLAAPSFIDNEPLSPILPTKHNHTADTALERTQRADDTTRLDATHTTARAPCAEQQCAATQCEAVCAVECGAQTDRTVEVQRVFSDAGTMTDESVAPAKAALSVCSQGQLSIEPSLKIVTSLEAAGSVRGGHSSCDNSPVVFHQEASGCSGSPCSPHQLSSACSSAASSPGSSIAVAVTGPAALLPTAASPLQATLMTLSTALSVPFPLPQAKLSTACQQSLHRILGLLRRQYSSSLQWFLDTAATTTAQTTQSTATVAASSSGKQASKPTGSSQVSASSSSGATALKPTWNPSINPAAPSRLLSSIRLHSHWQPDSSVSSCSHCQSAFSLLRRKHHCRLCGSTACDECSKKSVELGELGLPGLQRVCDVCEMVWSAGKGLKASGMPVVLLEVGVQQHGDDEVQLANNKASGRVQAAAGGKSRKRSIGDGRPAKPSLQQQQPDSELDVSVADKPALPHSAAVSAQSTPSLARSARVRATPAKRAADKEAAATPHAARRVTRSAAKENSNNINVPPAIPEATPRRLIKGKQAAHAPQTSQTAARLGRQ